jgi:hypothetical protein
MRSIVAFYASHELLFSLVGAFLVWPLITAAINYALKRKSPEEWEKWAMARPLAAFCIDVLRASGVEPFKILQAFQRFAARKAGKIPSDTWERLPIDPELRKALSEPHTRATLRAFLTPVETTPPSP